MQLADFIMQHDCMRGVLTASNNKTWTHYTEHAQQDIVACHLLGSLKASLKVMQLPNCSYIKDPSKARHYTSQSTTKKGNSCITAWHTVIECKVLHHYI